MKSASSHPLSRPFGIPAAVFGAVLAAAGFGALTAAHGLAWADYGKGLLGLLLLAYLPGRAALILLRLRLKGLESVVFSFLAGLALSTFLNKAARLLGVEAAFGAAIAAAAVIVAVDGVRRFNRSGRTRFRITWTAAGLAVLLALVAGMLTIDSFSNAVTRPDGSLSVRMHYYDGFVRHAVIGELAHRLPPQIPFAAGAPLGYHYGMDLFVTMFVRYLGLGIPDLLHRILAAPFWALLVLSAFLFGRELFDSARTGLLSAALVVFGSGGFSWLAGLVRGTPLGGNPFYSLYLFDGLGVNSIVPALALSLGGFAALTRYLRSRGAGRLILAALLLAGAAEFKIFFGPLFAGTLLVAGIAALMGSGDRGLLAAWAATTAAMAPMFLSVVLPGGGGMDYHFALRFVDWPSRVLEALKLGAWADAWKTWSSGGRISASSVAVFLPAWILTIGGALGPSLAVLPRLVRDGLTWGKRDRPRFFFAALAAASALYFFIFDVRLGGLDRSILNIYVFYLGLVVAQVYWADAVVRFCGRGGPAFRRLAFAGAILLALPNTVLFLQQKIRVPEERVFSSFFMDACRWLNRNTPPDAVLLQPLDVRYLSFLSQRAVILDDTVHSYLDFHLPRAEIGRRRDGINRFFESPEGMAEVLRRYGVSHVVISNDRDFPVSGPGGIVVEDARSRVDPGERAGRYRLVPVFRNGGFTVFRVDIG